MHVTFNAVWIVSALQYRPVIDDKYITASVWEMLEKATLTDHDVIIGVNQMDAVLIMDSYSTILCLALLLNSLY